MTAPVPVSATFSLATKLIVVNFDQPLVAGPLNAANWEGHSDIGAGLDKWTPVGVPQAVASRVQFISQTLAPSFVTDQVDYRAPPFDVIGLVGGLPAAAFTGFLMTQVP